MTDQNNESTEYVQMDSLAELSEAIATHLWTDHGRHIVSNARRDVGGIVRFLPRWLIERLVAYGLAATVFLMVAGVFDGSIEIMRRKVKDGTEGDGQVS